MPPRLARLLLWLACPRSERRDLLADLEDEASERAARDGAPAARRWYWRQLRASILPLTRRRGRLAVDRLRRGLQSDWRPFASLHHDVRDAARSIRRAPGFALLVVSTLALGIGVNTAIFTVVDALLFKSLPYRDADALVRVAEWPSTGGNYTVAPTAFLDWRGRTRTLARLEARLVLTVGVLGGDQAEQVRGARVTSGYFDLLGVTAARGRTFAPSDDQPGQPCRVVLSHRLWARRFNALESAIGQPARFTEGTCDVIGVLPADSVFDRAAVEAYFPLAFTPAVAQSNGRVLTVWSRVVPGASLDQARAEMAALAATFNSTRGSAGRGWTTAITPLRDVVMRADTRQLAIVLFVAVGVVLVVACVNITGLSLSRAIDRRRELMLRGALGAGRWRVFRLLLVESLVLASAGGAAGLLVGSVALRLFLSLAPPGTLPAEAAAALDSRALLFTGGLALAAGVLFGTLPAWQGAGYRPRGSTMQTMRIVDPRGRLHGTLLVVEIAMAVVLVTGAGLLAVSFIRLTGVNPGFATDRTITMPLTLPDAKYQQPADWAMFYERLLDGLRRDPSVAHASVVTSLPLGGWLFGTRFAVEGVPSDPARPTSAHIQCASTDYFETIGVPVVEGRAFTEADTARAPLVAMVNRTFARRFVGDGPAVGRRVTLGIDTADGRRDQIWTVVGVIANVKTGGLADDDLATPEIYVPHTQSPMPGLFVLVRSRTDGAAVAPALRSAIRGLDPDLPMSAITSLDEHLGASVRTQRFRTTMIAAFAVLAGVLATLGVYAVRARAVAARRREIGVRVALGATRGQVLGLLVGHGLRPVLAGLAIGIAAALMSTRLIQQWLFSTSATDPLVLAGVAIAIGAAGVIASWLPARRAASADPVAALRQD
jgi:putative ABC transport system permease protein